MLDKLQSFKDRQQRLIKLVDRFKTVVTALDDTALAGWMEQLGDRLAEDSFKVLILGPYDVGKTTLINAFIGQKILPAYMSPATAVPTEVKYSPHPYALLYPRNSGTPSRVPIEHLRDHVVVAPGKENPYRKVELYYPLDLCQNGVVIVDSPGLDDTVARDQVTRDYLHQADAIIFVSMAMGAFRDSEKKFFERYVLTLGHADSGFYVFNWFNHVEEPEKPGVISSAKRRLADVGVDKDNRVFFINAKGALDGRVAGDGGAVEASGVPKFENELQRFLAEERGPAKLLVAARELNGQVVKVHGVIQDRQRMCDQDAATLVNNFNAQKPRLEELDQRRKFIIAELNNEIRQILAQADQEVQRFLSLFAAKCPQWAIDAQTQTMLSASPTDQQIRAFEQEIVGFLEQGLRKLEDEWRIQYLRPMLGEQLVALEKRLRQAIESFILQVRGVQHTIASSGVASENLQEAVGNTLASTEELHVESALDTTGVTIALGKAEVISSLINATFFIPHLHYFVRAIAAVTAKGWLSQTRQKKAKQQIGEAVQRDLEQNISARADEYVQQVALPLRQLSDDQERILGAEIKTVREQVEAAIREKQTFENKMVHRRAELQNLHDEADQIKKACTDLIAEIE